MSNWLLFALALTAFAGIDTATFDFDHSGEQPVIEVDIEWCDGAAEGFGGVVLFSASDILNVMNFPQDGDNAIIIKWDHDTADSFEAYSGSWMVD